MKFTPAAIVAFLALWESTLAGGIEERDIGVFNNFAKRQQRPKTVTVHDVSTTVTTATVTVTLGAVKATPPPSKGQQNSPLKIASVSIPKQAPPKQAPAKQAPPKQAPPKKAPPKQAPPKKAPPKNNKSKNKKVVKTLTLTPGTYTTTSTSASESTFLSTWTTVAPVTATELATVTVTEAQPVTITVAGRPIKTKVVKTKTKVERVTKTKTAVVTQTAVVTATDFQTVVVTQTFQQPTTIIQTETVRETETVRVTDTNTAAAVTDTAVTDTAVTDTAVTDTAVTDTATAINTAVTDTATAIDTASVTDTAGATDSTDITATASDTAAPPAATEDPQESLTLDPRVIQPGLALDGQQVPVAGQVPSLTSKNNFINFCLTQNVPLTDGKQIRAGSCNVVPMGRIIPKANLPSSKFVFPKNFSTLKANEPFTIQMKVKNMELGFFTNAQLNYYAAPAQLNDANIIVGHTHVVIEPLTSLDQTEPADPTKFAFFKGVNSPPNGNGVVTADVAKGLAAGTYRLFSINTAANHMPVLASVAQHGCLDDGIYFTVV
jgi:hypothetical protein